MFGFFEEKSLPPSVPPDPAKLELHPEECQTLTLPDNRDLGYATYGSKKPSDPVIFLFHGMPGCRLVGRGWDKLCQRLGARLITIDRPGCGRSTLANRRLADWPDDVVSLADHLGINRFSVLGASGGGPYALACARFIPRERLRSTTVVCGIGPIESLLQNVPHFWGLTQWLVRMFARYLLLPSIVRPYLVEDPSRLKRVLEDQCKTPEEKAQFNDSNSEMSPDDAVTGLLEAFRQGPGGTYLDGTTLASDWGFDLKNVDSKNVWLVHGDQDVQAPLKMAQYVDKQLGGGCLKVLEGKTHFTIWKEHSEEILRKAAEA